MVAATVACCDQDGNGKRFWSLSFQPKIKGMEERASRRRLTGTGDKSAQLYSSSRHDGLGIHSLSPFRAGRSPYGIHNRWSRRQDAARPDTVPELARRDQTARNVGGRRRPKLAPENANHQSSEEAVVGEVRPVWTNISTVSPNGQCRPAAPTQSLTWASRHPTRCFPANRDTSTT
jgi:hypothetical protein